MMRMNGVENSGLLSLSLPEHSGRAMMDGSSEVDQKWKGCRSSSYKLQAHSQIMRIRAEDSHVGEDKFGVGMGVAHFMLFSRPMLPASPLSGKTAH